MTLDNKALENPWNSGCIPITYLPEASELIGRYQFTQRSIAEQAKQGYNLNNTTLELNNDHQYVLTDGPSGFLVKPDASEKTIHSWVWRVFYDQNSGYTIEIRGFAVVQLCKMDGVMCIPISSGPPKLHDGIVLIKVD